jgi:hypothetical protein
MVNNALKVQGLTALDYLQVYHVLGVNLGLAYAPRGGENSKAKCLDVRVPLVPFGMVFWY